MITGTGLRNRGAKKTFILLNMRNTKTYKSPKNYINVIVHNRQKNNFAFDIQTKKITFHFSYFCIEIIFSSWKLKLNAFLCMPLIWVYVEFNRSPYFINSHKIANLKRLPNEDVSGVSLSKYGTLAVIFWGNIDAKTLSQH